MQVKKLFRCCNGFPELNGGGRQGSNNGCAPNVTREQDGQLACLTEKGKRPIECRPGEVTYPPVGILYIRDSLEAALQAAKEYKVGGSESNYG